MAYTVELNTSAQRDYKNLDRSIALRIDAAIAALEQDPRPDGCVKLSGKEHTYRVRVGSYRIVYAIDDRPRTVSIKHIQHRREVYRR